MLACGEDILLIKGCPSSTHVHRPPPGCSQPGSSGVSPPCTHVRQLYRPTSSPPHAHTRSSSGRWHCCLRAARARAVHGRLHDRTRTPAHR
ncbi:hypothetical protein VTO73DRAFT_9729 [Trametes versicolor]